MKRDRNSFFTEYGMSSFNNMQPMMPNMMPEVNANTSFYAGPAQMNNNNDTYTNDFESRISKLERQVNRLESRINKLEGEYPTNYSKTTTDEYNYSNSSMYMV